MTFVYLKSSDTLTIGYSDIFANPQWCHCNRSYLYLLLPPPPDDLQLEKKLSPETFFCPELFPLEVKLRLGAVVVE